VQAVVGAGGEALPFLEGHGGRPVGAEHHRAIFIPQQGGEKEIAQLPCLSLRCGGKMEIEGQHRGTILADQGELNDFLLLRVADKKTAAVEHPHPAAGEHGQSPGCMFSLG